MLLLDLRQATNMITATMTQTTMAVEAGMMMLSSRLEPPIPSVRISLQSRNFHKQLNVNFFSFSQFLHLIFHFFSLAASLSCLYLSLLVSRFLCILLLLILFDFLSVCLSVFLSFCLSVFLSFCLSVFLSFCVFVRLSV